jgi:flagellin
MPVIGTNPSALNATFYLNQADHALTKSIRRLSSGSRLADPADDAAGVSVSGKLTSATRRLAAASEGAGNLISFLQVADGFLNVINDELTRLSELALRATNGAFSASDRANYSTEFEALTSAITTQVTNAKFNGAAVFQTAAATGTVTVGVNADGTNIFSIVLRDVRDATGVTAALEGLNTLSISTTSGASAAIASLTSNIERIATARASVNSSISVLNFFLQNIATEKINTETANSRIKDLDFAAESTELAKQSIIVQSATAMLAQANVVQESVLALLR